jgi:hypothetical protein
MPPGFDDASRGQGLACQQVHRNGIAGEGVHRQQVERLRQFTLERQSGIAEYDVACRLAPLEIAKIFPCDLRHSWVDVVEAITTLSLA